MRNGTDFSSLSKIWSSPLGSLVLFRFSNRSFLHRARHSTLVFTRISLLIGSGNVLEQYPEQCFQQFFQRHHGE